LGAEIFIRDYEKFPYVAVNYSRMEVSDKAVKSTMTPFGVPVDFGAIAGFQKRLEKDGNYLGLDIEVGAYFKDTYMSFGLPYPDLDLPSTEEVGVQES
jgi:hypothetical protein